MQALAPITLEPNTTCTSAVQASVAADAAFPSSIHGVAPSLLPPPPFRTSGVIAAGKAALVFQGRISRPRADRVHRPRRS